MSIVSEPFYVGMRKVELVTTIEESSLAPGYEMSAGPRARLRR